MTMMSMIHLLLLILCLPHARPLRDSRVEVVAALQAHFWAGCVFLVGLEEGLNSNLTISKEAVRLHTLLSQRSIPTAILGAAALGAALRCHRNRALHVIVPSGAHIQQVALQQLFVGLKRPCGPRWLLFLDFPEDSLGAVDIPFDCEFLVASGTEPVELREMFRVSGAHPLQSARWGSWSSQGGLRSPDRSLERRRRDLQGLVLTAAVNDSPPFIYLREDSHGIIHIDGLFERVWQEITQELNFSLALVKVDKNAFGIRRSDGSYNGALGMMLAGRINLTVTPFFTTVARTEIVDFVAPTIRSRTHIYIRSPDGSEKGWSALLAPLSVPLWMCVGGCILLTSGYLCAVHRLTSRHEQGSGIQDSLLCVWGAFCAQGHATTPSQWSCRIIHWTVFVTALTVMVAYSAKFISFLTVHKIVLPFTNLQGLLDDNTYDFIVEANASLYQSFQTASDSVMTQVYKQKILPNKDMQPTDPLTGFRGVCEKRIAYMTVDYDLEGVRNDLTCDLSMLPEDSLAIQACPVLPKGSPFRRIINVELPCGGLDGDVAKLLNQFGLQEMLRSGRFQRHYLHWFPPLPEHGQEALRSVRLAEVAPLLALGGVGLLAGLLTWLLEICHAGSEAYTRHPCTLK